MGFLDNVLSEVYSAPFPKEPPCRILILGDSAGYFEHVKSIISYNVDKVVLLVKNKTITVLGEELVIKKFCGGDVVICGKISSVIRS